MVGLSCGKPDQDIGAEVNKKEYFESQVPVEIEDGQSEKENRDRVIEKVIDIGVYQGRSNQSGKSFKTQRINTQEGQICLQPELNKFNKPDQEEEESRKYQAQQESFFFFFFWICLHSVLWGF